VSKIRFFTDEDVYGAVAPALRKAGFDAISTPECGRLGQSDESQLRWAAEQGRVLVTFNVAHFAGLHSEWIRSGEHHSGLAVSIQRPVGDLLRRLIHLAEDAEAEAMHDRLEFLSSW
jgi:hypothetical protein